MNNYSLVAKLDGATCPDKIAGRKRVQPRPVRDRSFHGCPMKRSQRSPPPPQRAPPPRELAPEVRPQKCGERVIDEIMDPQFEIDPFWVPRLFTKPEFPRGLIFHFVVFLFLFGIGSDRAWCQPSVP